MSIKKTQKILPKSATKKYTYQLLDDRGVDINEIAKIVKDLQQPYLPHITIEECLEHIHAVLHKREVQNAVITGIELDIAAENQQLSPLLTKILMNDEGLYGIDETLVLAIVNVYGSIGLTNFGYLDKLKPGIIGQLDSMNGDRCNTFLDDIISAIAAAAASRMAHSYPSSLDVPEDFLEHH